MRTAVLCEFLEAIEDKKRYLRHIIIEAGGYAPIKMEEACTLLTAAKSFRKLEIAHIDVCGGIEPYRRDRIWPRAHQPGSVVDRCTPLLRAIHAS